MIWRLVSAIEAAGLDIDAEAIADALWLARHQVAEPGGEGQMLTAAARSAPTEPRPPDAEPQDPVDDIQAGGLEAEGHGGIAPGDSSGPGPGAAASSVTLAKAPALPGVLELGRALRPLKQRHPSKRRRVLDVDATVQYFCDTSVLTPVMRPGAERWFDVDVFVDVSPSMAVWQDTVAEFVSMLRRHGAFRTVRRWNLEQRDGEVHVSRAPGLRFTAAQLADPGARRLTIVLTDGIGSSWYEAPTWEAIRRWGLSCPVALLSPLPKRLWAGTALQSTEVRLRSHRPGTANQSLEVSLPWWWSDDEPPRSTVPVPVLTLDAAEVAAWARMTMGVGGAETSGVFAMPPPGRAAKHLGGAPRDAEDLVRRFRVSVSPVAYRLAIYLSAVLLGRWEVGMARIVQDAVLPESGHVHLAEVLIGGLVRQGEPSAGQQEPTFEFIEGVAAVLRRSLPGTEALRLLQALSRTIERATGQSSGIAALLIGQGTETASTGAFADLRAGAANLIDTMGLSRTPAPLNPPRRDQSSPAELRRNMPVEILEAEPFTRRRTFPAMPLPVMSELPGDMALLLVATTSAGYLLQLFSGRRNFVGNVSFDHAPDLAGVLRAIDAGTTRDRLATTGRTLWRDLIPTQINDAFWDIRDEIDMLTIMSNSPLPWELLYPHDREHDEGFLVEQFPVTRVDMTPYSPATRITLDGITFVSSQPSPWALAEVETLRRTRGLAGKKTRAVDDLSTLLSLIDSGRAGSLHISCRLTAPDNSDEPGIALADGLFQPSQLGLTRWAGTQPGAAPLVFISQHGPAHEAAVQYGLIESLGSQFVAVGATAFVGNAWAVSDRAAATFTQAFYESLAQGATLGTAAHRARNVTRDSVPDTSWLAYIVIGDPQATAVSPVEATDSQEPNLSQSETSSAILAEDGGTIRAEDGEIILAEGRGTSRQAITARTARVVAVHGMGQQMQGPSALERLWLPALQDGLLAAGADPLGSDDELAIAFYGDLLRPAAATKLSTAPEEDLALEAGESASAEELLPLWRAAATEIGIPEPQQNTSEAGSPNWIASAMSTVLSSRFFSGLTERMLIGDLQQMRRYLTEPDIRHAAQQRLTAAIRPETRVIVAHSLGSIVAYETLCAHPEWEVPMLVTLGSPLGLGFVFDRLQPPPNNGLGSWPGSTRRWVNVADNGDLMAVKRLAALFAGPISDVQTNNGAKAHDVTRYLSSAATGSAVATGLAD